MPEPAEPAPEVAVVVATYNRSARLRLLLASLAAQSLARDRYEVVVVDDASTDDTQLALGEATRQGLPVRSLRIKRGGGPAAARERGWRSSRAALIAFIDDDCHADPGWLESIVTEIQPDDWAFLQGRTAPNPAELGRLGPFARTIDIGELTTTFNTCNMVYPRAVLERIDGFDTEAFGDRRTAGEDTDLAWRAIEVGAQPRFEPTALAFHAVEDLGPVGMLRIAARWTPAVRAFARHPRLRHDRLVHGVFWKPTHMWLARALLAAVLPRRLWPLAAWLALPYVRSLWARAKLAGNPGLAPYYIAFDLIETAAIVRGAARERTPMA